MKTLLLATLLSGCTLLDVEVDAPEVCVVYPELHVDGIDTGMPTATIERSFTVDDLDALHQLTDHDAEVSFVRATILALDGIDDFTFVHAARVDIAAGDDTNALPPLELYTCDDGSCVTDGGALDMTGTDRPDTVAYLRHDAVDLTLALTGQPPANDWTLSVDVCFQARAHYAYGGDE